MTKWLIESLHGFQYSLNLLHSCKIWHLDLIGYIPHGHLNSSLGKNLSLYSPIGAWLVIALEALAHKEFKWPKYFSQAPPLMYNGSMILSSPSSRLRNCFPLKSDAWKVIFQIFAILSHWLFLLKSQDILQGKRGIGLNDLVSLSTTLWRFQLQWLGHSQNSMELSWWRKKKRRSSLRIAVEWTWYGCEEGSNIFMVACIEPVTTIIFDMSLWFIAWLIPHLIVNNSASVLMTWTTWWSVLEISLLQMCICDINMAMLLLTLASMIMRASEGILEDSITILLSWWIHVFRLSFFCLLNKLKEKWSEKVSITLKPKENSG